MFYSSMASTKKNEAEEEVESQRTKVNEKFLFENKYCKM